MSEPTPLIAKLANCLSDPLTVIDVGCRWGPADRWRQIPNVRVFGFDPDPAECERLNQQAANDPLLTYVPLALGAVPGVAQLHIAAEPACSSLYPPDEELVGLRPSLALISKVGQEEVSLETLDRWCAENNVGGVDFLKIDTQGAELDVLKGAEQTLGSVRVVEVEVEFNPIYIGQPLFPAVDSFLRKHGFVLWRVANLTHYGLAAGLSAFETSESHFFDSPEPVTFQGGGGQLFWANAFYVRSTIANGSDRGGWQDWLADTVVAGGLGFLDLAAQSAAAGRSKAPPEIRGPLEELVLALLPVPATPTEVVENQTAPTESSDSEDELVPLRPYSIGDFSAEAGARLGTELSERSRSAPGARLKAIQEADLKPALPYGEANPAAISSRRVVKTVHLGSVEFDVVVDPEMDDWKTAAYLVDEGHLADAALVELVLKLAAPGEVVLDVGAFIGGLSLPAAAGGCDVVAMEPWSHASDLLRASASLNRFKNLKVLRAAASDEAGMADFFPAGLYGRIALEADMPVVAVPTVRVDDVVTELGSPRVRLVRLDVEGAELSVLNGMTGLLGTLNPPAVLFEADEAAMRKMGYNQRLLFERFEELGFELYQVGDRTLTRLGSGEWTARPVVDCIAVKGLAPAVPGWKLTMGSVNR